VKLVHVNGQLKLTSWLRLSVQTKRCQLCLSSSHSCQSLFKGERMRETQTKVIDGHTYQVQMLPGTKTWKLILRLSKMVGPSLGKMIDSTDGNIGQLLESNIKDVFIGEAITALVERMDEADVEITIQQLAECTLVNNKPLKPIFDLHFQGDGIGVVKWLMFAIKANIGPFSIGQAKEQSDQSEQGREAQA
jgi:hypothetical protein